MIKDAVEKLTDKGFDGAQIHWFLRRFGIGITLHDPPRYVIFGNEHHVKRMEAFYQEIENKRLAREQLKWNEASIAADFERHK